MAKANAKKRAEENKARIALLFRVLVGSIVTFAVVRLGMFRASSRWWHYPLFAMTAGAAWFCYTSLAFIAAPSYDASGALEDGGADLSIGGMSSYYHDIVYVAVFLLVSTALISDWFWLIGLVVRSVLTTIKIVYPIAVRCECVHLRVRCLAFVLFPP